MTTDTDYDDDLDWDEESDCRTCGGDGWGVVGDDWDAADPFWDIPRTIQRCPNCRGSGLAKDQQFW